MGPPRGTEVKACHVKSDCVSSNPTSSLPGCVTAPPGDPEPSRTKGVTIAPNSGVIGRSPRQTVAPGTRAVLQPHALFFFVRARRS